MSWTTQAIVETKARIMRHIENQLGMVDGYWAHMLAIGGDGPSPRDRLAQYWGCLRTQLLAAAFVVAKTPPLLCSFTVLSLAATLPKTGGCVKSSPPRVSCEIRLMRSSNGASSPGGADGRQSVRSHKNSLQGIGAPQPGGDAVEVMRRETAGQASCTPTWPAVTVSAFLHHHLDSLQDLHLLLTVRGDAGCCGLMKPREHAAAPISCLRSVGCLIEQEGVQSVDLSSRKGRWTKNRKGQGTLGLKVQMTYCPGYSEARFEAIVPRPPWHALPLYNRRLAFAQCALLAEEAGAPGRLPVQLVRRICESDAAQRPVVVLQAQDAMEGGGLAAGGAVELDSVVVVAPEEARARARAQVTPREAGKKGRLSTQLAQSETADEHRFNMISSTSWYTLPDGAHKVYRALLRKLLEHSARPAGGILSTAALADSLTPEAQHILMEFEVAHGVRPVFARLSMLQELVELWGGPHRVSAGWVRRELVRIRDHRLHVEEQAVLITAFECRMWASSQNQLLEKARELCHVAQSLALHDDEKDAHWTHLQKIVQIAAGKTSDEASATVAAWIIEGVNDKYTKSLREAVEESSRRTHDLHTEMAGLVRGRVEAMTARLAESNSGRAQARAIVSEQASRARGQLLADATDTLKLWVCEARRLPPMDDNLKADPYFVIEYRDAAGEKFWHQSATCRETLQPDWQVTPPTTTPHISLNALPLVVSPDNSAVHSSKSRQRGWSSCPESRRARGSVSSCGTRMWGFGARRTTLSEGRSTKESGRCQLTSRRSPARRPHRWRRWRRRRHRWARRQ